MLKQSCETLPGVGPTLTARLAKCGIKTLADLLFHLPYRYQDRTRITPIADLRSHDHAVITGRIVKTEITFGKRKIFNCFIEDKTGFIRLRFFQFNQHQMRSFQENKLVHAFGEVREFSNKLEMIHPEYKLGEEETTFQVEESLTPIYPSTKGLSQSRLRQIIQLALNQVDEDLESLEWMDDEKLQKGPFCSFPHALKSLHRPSPEISLISLENGNHPGLKRVAFDELLGQQISLQFARQHRIRHVAPAMPFNANEFKQFLINLKFSLTQAQQRVIQEISHDLATTKPMLRLVQGDVGSGKTVVAAIAALQALKAGYQVALMAPTELLSEQHFTTLKQLLYPHQIICLKLNGNMKAKERRETLQCLVENSNCLLVGTHALFQEEVAFSNLGLIIIDEQHRFGVEQRLMLQQKGIKNSKVPHQLLMTATPIPRTLAMTQLSHLEISTIDELPPGRTPIKTVVLSQEKREELIQRLKKAISEKRQIYWVCTLIEESETLQCMAAVKTAQDLQEQLPEVRIGLIHGRMKSTEKDKIMLAFKSGEMDLLVATTVIEVGVDVPNASLIIIENAERLGLSQLHQLRGRVGRGATESYCVLLYQNPISQIAKERLQIMKETNDGFVVAEKDLLLRGGGDLLGTRQTGYHQYKIANLIRDKALIPNVRAVAAQLISDNSDLAKEIAARWLGDYEQFLQA